MKYAGLWCRPAQAVQSVIRRNITNILPASVSAQAPSTKPFSAALRLAKAGLPVFFCAPSKRPTCPHGFAAMFKNCDKDAAMTLPPKDSSSAPQSANRPNMRGAIIVKTNLRPESKAWLDKDTNGAQWLPLCGEAPSAADADGATRDEAPPLYIQAA